MADNTTILMRRLGIKTEKVKTSWFSSEKNRKVLDGELGADEVLCAVRKDGKEPHVVGVGKDGVFADGMAPTEDETLFAVRRTPVSSFEMMIPAGNDRDGFKWLFEVGGKLEITKPESFASSFRGNDMPLDAATFAKELGTIPMTVMHDKVTNDVLEVMSLEDKGADEQYADIRKSLEAWRLANESFVTSAIGGVFTSYFNDEGVARLMVSTFRARSQEREEDDARKKIEDEQARIIAVNKAAADNAAKTKQMENNRRRTEELAEKKHSLEMAVLDQKIAALKGPRPEIWMEAPIYVQGNRVQTRDCVLVTSGDYGKPTEGRLSNRPKNTISVGDLLEFNLRANIDGWLHLYNYGTSGKVSPLFTNRHIFKNETYSIRRGGNLYDGWLCVNDKTKTTRESGRLERFIAIITREKIQLDENSVKAVFDKRNPGKGFATRGAFDSVEEVLHAEEEVPLEEAMASLVDLPPEDWVQGTLELEVA